MAVSQSTNTLKLYSPVTRQYYGECKGHSGTINRICFSAPFTPHVLHSCSSDGTIRASDSRSIHQEIFSFSFGGSTDNLLAFGCNSQVLLVFNCNLPLLVVLGTGRMERMKL
ncbi:WD repeat-containing protein GTS1-like [Mangifera indica]|uniref:WD repeat-containing protein GTS1-like n=1 Tax=Mangifera indica TaxID=29780 RepID=UPI001CFB5D0F|nr:WD repeat-containing protein GTS1-like [Mangifera indica]